MGVGCDQDAIARRGGQRYLYIQEKDTRMDVLSYKSGDAPPLAFAVPAAHDRRGGLTARRKKEPQFFN